MSDSRSDVRTAWQFDHHQITCFAELLFEAGYLDTARLILDFMAKPFKWQPEYDLWISFERPEPTNPQDAVRWASFAEKLAAL